MKNLALYAAMATALLCSSCLGPNNTFNAVANWNQKVTPNRWVNEAIFLGFWAVPVYEFCYLGDIIIFNSIGFWKNDE